MKKKVSLVLSGGGARGMAHIGVIEELERQGFEIISISGTSIGALIGGVYALGKIEELKKWLYTLDKAKVFNLIDFTINKQGLIKGDKVLNKMKNFIPDANIEDLNITYRAIAADILNKEEVVFTTGSIYNAIRASIAIPSVITPVITDGKILVDGGVLNNIPINHAKRIQNDILVVVNVNADIPIKRTIIQKEESQSIYLKRIKEFYHKLRKNNSLNHYEDIGYFELVNKTIRLMTYHMSQLSLERYSQDILINVSQDACKLFDFYKAEEMVDIGRYAAIKSINKYNDSLRSIKDQSKNLKAAPNN